ncbi:MAG: tRNA lysidine(34) synthetase TilS [Pseudomonadota bacterium]|nr:tRNA lysidine(34) synthetase TilS [Pseudomonadota bacterium]
MTKLPPAEALAASLRGWQSTDPAGALGIAVSGGSDSLALLYLASDWARDQGVDLHVMTVDHGLRAEAAQEAAFVADHATTLGLPHRVLRWQGWDGQGNLMDQARRARYRLMADWAREQGLNAVLLGHTLDDQAETLMMRLARGAGVDGLAAMVAQGEQAGFAFLRPLLSVRRDALRAELTARNVTWVEDPSNDDTRFERVRMRQSLTMLAQQGVEAEALSQSAQNLAEARGALNWAVAQFAGKHVTQRAGDLAIAAAPFADLPAELQRRLLQHALGWIAGPGYAPRSEALAQLRAQALAGQGATLSGVRMTHRKGTIYLFRELAAVADMTTPVDQPFDTRWQLSGPGGADLHIAPLGEDGLQACPKPRESLRPAAALQADPAIWRDNQLISAPLAGFLQGWQAELAPNCRDFAKWTVSR